ncbi:MAG TPA: Crp/Fnr family transcriptional regulator [Chryseosolibacter sp.]
MQSIVPLPEPVIRQIHQMLVPIRLPKNFRILEAPKVSDHVYFINSGSAMSFTFDEGKKQVEWLWKSGQLIISPKSFFERVPSHEFLQLLDDAELLCMSYENVSFLLNEFPQIRIAHQVIMTKYYQQCRQRLRDMQRLTARERYEKLVSSFPRIGQLLPQEQIASYLGITPQSLSRIKRESRF